MNVVVAVYDVYTTNSCQRFRRKVKQCEGATRCKNVSGVSTGFRDRSSPTSRHTSVSNEDDPRTACAGYFGIRSAATATPGIRNTRICDSDVTGAFATTTSPTLAHRVGITAAATSNPMNAGDVHAESDSDEPIRIGVGPCATSPASSIGTIDADRARATSTSPPAIPRDRPTRVSLAGFLHTTRRRPGSACPAPRSTVTTRYANAIAPASATAANRDEGVTRRVATISTRTPCGNGPSGPASTNRHGIRSSNGDGTRSLIDNATGTATATVPAATTATASDDKDFESD